MVCCCLSAFALTLSQIGPGSTVQVEVSGFSVCRGVAVVAFFYEESWETPIDLSRARHVVMSPIINSRVFTELRGIPHGRFVVLVFHDEDGDSRLDCGEDTALSSSTGYPTDDLSFEALAVMNKTATMLLVMEVSCSSLL